MIKIAIASTLALCGSLVFPCAPGNAQTAGPDGAWKRGAETVSVGTLRTPAKARQHFEKARSAAIAGHRAEYETELAAALSIAPEFGEAYVLRAVQEVEDRRYDAAIADTLTARRVEPGIAWATIVHAEACNGLRRFDEAIALLDGLSSPEIGTWQAKYEMARAVIGHGDVEASLQWTKLTLEAVPPSKKGYALLLRANALQLAHRWQDALAQFDQYLGLDATQTTMRSQVISIRERVQTLAAGEKTSAIAER